MKGIFFPILMAVCLSANAQTEALWLRYPAISPDGSTIVFTYKGDLYKVASSGGAAVPLTMNDAEDFMPVWSADGKSIAFASDRYGNFDIFIMPAAGGEAKRLTYHSAPEYPYSFSPDGKSIVFGSSRLDDASNRQYPTGSMPELYAVSMNGGRVEQILTTPAEDVKFSPDGKLMAYHDKKGGENPWRKHHTSAITRDLWIYNTQNGQHTKLTGFAGEDRNPVWSADGKSIYYLSEEQGSFNVRKMASTGGASQAVTSFKTHPVRFLSAASNGTLCFGYDGSLYTLNGGSPAKLQVFITGEAGTAKLKNIPFSSGVRGMELSPNGKEIAFVYRGDVFVTNVEGSTTKQVTKTAEAESGITWMANGRGLMYASERGGQWKIYQAEITRKEEPYFFASTLIKESPVSVNAKKETTDPKISPDGKEFAYTEGFNTLKIRNIESGNERTLVAAAEWLTGNDRGHSYDWSPDSKWLLFSYTEPGIGNSEIAIVPADGSAKLKNLSLSGFGDFSPKWMMNGKMLLWFSDRDGLVGKANSSGHQEDAYALFLTQESWDQFRLNKEDAALEKELKDKEAKKDSSKKKDTVTPLKIDWKNLENRKARLTIHSSSLSDAVVDNSGENLYYLARFEKGLNLWTTNLRTKETKILAPLNANSGELVWDKEGKKIILLADGGLSKIDPATGKSDKISISGEMALDADAERMGMYNHILRRTNDIFYKTGFHGADWAGLGKDYRKFLPHIGNNVEMTEMLSELLGELNISHCWASFNGNSPDDDATASLGIMMDYGYNGIGLKIAEILPEGPLDKAGLDVKPGTIIEAIDGDTLTRNVDYAQLLNRKAGKLVLLSLLEDGKRREITIKPISGRDENGLLYTRWVKRNADEVDKLSNGTLGYIHIPGMGDGPYRKAIEEAMGKYAGRKALVVDTRNNGGGDLVADLAMWLSGKRFLQYGNDRENTTFEPTFRWNKPSISLANEANYSDGHCYAYSYQYLNIGKLVGMPVPGTCTFAGWESLQDPSMRWGVPPIGVKTMEGKYLENAQTEPDIKVMNEYKVVAKGMDAQLEAAVAELMKEIR